MLPVEFAEPFFAPEPVELGRDNRGGVLVGGPGDSSVRFTLFSWSRLSESNR
jgi:hypothetical protein